MKKILFIGLVVWLSLNAFANSVKADTKTETIIGHVITQTIQGNDMDHAEVMSNELAALMHQYSIEMTHILLQYIIFLSTYLMHLTFLLNIL